MQCNSCKNSKSTERCKSSALKNLNFCGKHVRAKNPRLWSVVNFTGNYAVKIQKIWRGYAVRYMLTLAGNGVLKRSICHNQEDVVTFESKVHPFDFFSFEEDGFVYWFDAKSMYRLMIENVKPQNPYTRHEISVETRKRFKKFMLFRKTRGRELLSDNSYLLNPSNRLGMYWITICQILEENLFEEIPTSYFVLLNPVQLWAFTGLLQDNLLLWAKEHKNIKSPRNLYYMTIRHCWKNQLYSFETPEQILYYLGKVILRIIEQSNYNYEICFKILSALHSL
jgi:hypothetical protein